MPKHKRGRETLKRWTILFSSKKEDPRAIGASWVMSGSLPSCVLPWPVVYKTRREAREMAQYLVKKHAYLQPTHSWKFRAVRLVLSVVVEV